jgi:hypothetical protein
MLNATKNVGSEMNITMKFSDNFCQVLALRGHFAQIW